MTDLSSLLDKMEKCSEETLGVPKRTNKCTGRNKCRYYAECFDEEQYEDNSIVYLNGAKNRYDMQKAGIKYLKEANIDLIEGTKIQYAQIVADKNGGLFVDELALKSWLDTVSYPITF